MGIAAYRILVPVLLTAVSATTTETTLASRGTPHGVPPSQNRVCAIYAHGSQYVLSLRIWTGILGYLDGASQTCLH